MTGEKAFVARPSSPSKNKIIKFDLRVTVNKALGFCLFMLQYNKLLINQAESIVSFSMLRD